MVATQAVRRAVQMDTARGPAGVSLGMAAAWLAASVALCSMSTGPLCIVSFVFAGLMSAANIAGYRGGNGGAVAERALLTIAASPIGNLIHNSSQSNSVSQIFDSHPNEIELLGTYDFNFVQNGTLLKRGYSINRPLIHFSSSLGEHVAIHTEEISHDDFAHIISSATPDVPDKYSNTTHTKRGWSFDASWLSYNYDNVNDNLALNWVNNIHDDNEYQLEQEMYGFMNANDAYKYCVSPTIGNNLDDISSGGFNNGDVQTAMHGEIYFNTYGGVDGQCNDYDDCFTGDCGF